jgi:hypothetical protein
MVGQAGTLSFSNTRIPAAWLKLAPTGYQIPLWRWLVLPASTFVLKKRGGVWTNGDLAIEGEELRFTQVTALKLSKLPTLSWTIPLSEISGVETSKGMASETLSITHQRGVEKLLTARSQDFVDHLRTVIGPR